MQHLRLGLILGLTAFAATLPSCNKNEPPTNPPADGGGDGAEEGGAEEGGAEEGGAEEGGAEEGGDAYDPCAGKSCGDPCTICDPADADCVETAEVKQCNAAGECSGQAATCE